MLEVSWVECLSGSPGLQEYVEQLPLCLSFRV